MKSASAYITHLASRGQHHFSTQEAQAALGVSLPAIRAALRRLNARGEIADPYRGFHVIVPPEYRKLGCLPAEQFVPSLLEHLGERYYVALLSAAEFHGAAHHRPQAFQVMVRKFRRPVACGAVRIQFVARRDLDQIPTLEVNTPRGRLRISSPEATALDLVGYVDQAGGLDNVASVLTDLVERLDASKLAAVARHCPVSWVQRLGYLLDLADAQHMADALVDQVRERAAVLTPLVHRAPIQQAPRLNRWRLAVNVIVEPDA